MLSCATEVMHDCTAVRRMTAVRATSLPPPPEEPQGGALRGVCTLCEKWATLDPFSQMAKVMAVTIVFPDTGLP